MHSCLICPTPVSLLHAASFSQTRHSCKSVTTGCGAVQAAQAAWEQDALDRAAALARAALPSALPALHNALSSLLHPIASGAQPSAAALECLCWQLRLAAAVLADAGQNETPIVPVELLELCEAQGNAVDDAAALGSTICQVRVNINLAFIMRSCCSSVTECNNVTTRCYGMAVICRWICCGLIIGAELAFMHNRAHLPCVQVASWPTDDHKRQFASPRLLEAALAAFARWLDTYVAPEEPLPPACAPLSHAEQLPEASVLSLAVHIVAAVLQCYPQEQDLHTVAIRNLLHCLVNRPGRCAAVCQLPAWSELCTAVVHGTDALTSLHSKLQRRLVAAICGAVARSQHVPRVPEGGNGPVSPRAGEAARQSKEFLQQLLTPSLQLVEQIAGAQGANGRTGAAEAVGQAHVVGFGFSWH